MPVSPTYPGVYVEEIPSGVRTITGVSTSVAAFLDFFPRGPMNRAVRVFNMGDFEREFGGLDTRSEASYGIQQFFLNGGSEAWVVRAASTDTSDPTNTPTRASVEIGDSNNASALVVTAVDEGTWGDGLRLSVEYPSPADDVFNLTISEVRTVAGRQVVVREEVFRNLSMWPAQTNYVERVLNDGTTGSKLVRVASQNSGSPNPTRPAPNGTLSGNLPAAVTFNTGAPPPALDVTIGGATAEATFPAGPNYAAPVPRGAVAGALESAIRAARPNDPAFSGATVVLFGDQLLIRSGAGDPLQTVGFAAGSSGDADTFVDLLLDPPQLVNFQEYPLGASGVAGTPLIGGTEGKDGVPPNATDMIGDLNNKTGLHALEDVDLFNLLCLPRTSMLAGPHAMPPVQAAAVIEFAEIYCGKRRAFFVVDTPTGHDEPKEIQNWLVANANLRDRNAALYYPRVEIRDPLNDFQARSVGASGTIAGLCARIDGQRGVWKAPAGTEATLQNVSRLEYVLSDSENGSLNPLGINCLRNFPVYGSVCWGARTLDGSDQQASEWKYVPVRRLALFLEESLYRGTQWVVFEPNDEPLWAQIRLNVGAFLHRLFRQGAFQGQTPQDAYLVKCDAETTTQADINNGIVNIVVGFAPLKPAEFVILKIQQLAGQIQA